MTEKAVYFDSSKCTACKGCQVACKTWNNLPSPLGTNEAKWSGTHQNPVDLNGDTRLIITFNELEGDSKIKPVKWAFGRRACQHCTDAPCASVCPGGALVRNEETGFVEVYQDKCVGCQYCHSACPFDVPRYESNGLLDKTVIDKCTGCADRVAHGMAPACVSACQPNALQFGDRDEMIAKGKEKVAWLHENGYPDACLYGEHEMGGLHVIQVLKYGIDAHDQVQNPKAPATAQLTQIMKPVTGAISGLFVFVPQLAQAVGADTVFVIRMSHRVLGFIFVLVPLISAIMAPKSVAHIFKNLFAKWSSDDKKWMLLFFPYPFMAKWIHMPDQDEVKSGQRFADGMLWVAGAQLDGMTCIQLFANRLRSRRRVPQVLCGSCSARSFQ